MFRIDRNYVRLAAMRSVQVSNVDEEAGAAQEQYPDAAVLAAQALAAKATLLAEEVVSDAKAKAERIVADARNEVAALLLSARDQAEEDRRRAWQEGFAEGSEEGRRSFDEQLADKQRMSDESLRRVLDELYDERTRTYNGLENEVVTLALEIVRKVINPAEEELGGVFKSLIINALKQIKQDSSIIIRVGPVEYERFFSSGNAAFELESGVTVTASILRDVSLEECGCIIDTDDATVNAGLESQLQYIKLAFDKAES